MSFFLFFFFDLVSSWKQLAWVFCLFVLCSFFFFFFSCSFLEFPCSCSWWGSDGSGSGSLTRQKVSIVPFGFGGNSLTGGRGIGCQWNGKKSDPACSNKCSSVSNLFTKLSPDPLKNSVCVLGLFCKCSSDLKHVLQIRAMLITGFGNSHVVHTFHF